MAGDEASPFGVYTIESDMEMSNQADGGIHA